MTREEAIRRLEEGAPFSELYDEEWENALVMAIEALKAEPVVRCKDCKHLNKEEMRCFNVEGLGYLNVVDDDFCSRSKREESEK